MSRASLTLMDEDSQDSALALLTLNGELNGQNGDNYQPGWMIHR